MTAGEGDAVLLRSTMLNIATGYSKNALSCSELNGEHAGEGFRSLRHMLTPLWACKAQKCRFSRKFDLWPDLTRSNIDLGPKTIWAIARSRRGASTGLFREALRLSGADRQGGGVVPTPPDRLRYEKCPDRARVKSLQHIVNVSPRPRRQKNFYDRSPHVFQSNWFTITLPTHTKARTHTSHTVIHTSLPTNHTAIRHLPGTSLRGRSPAAPASGGGGGWLTLGSPGHLSPHCIQITFKRHVMPHPMPCHATSCHTYLWTWIWNEKTRFHRIHAALFASLWTVRKTGKVNDFFLHWDM